MSTWRRPRKAHLTAAPCGSAGCSEGRGQQRGVSVTRSPTPARGKGASARAHTSVTEVGIRWQKDLNGREYQGRLLGQWWLVNGKYTQVSALPLSLWGSMFHPGEASCTMPALLYLPGSLMWYVLCVLSAGHSVLCECPLGHQGLLVLSPQCLVGSSSLFHSHADHHALLGTWVAAALGS